MELRHLRSFVAVADARSMRRAAGQLHVAQPALSRTIRDLEHELGLTLFERSAHGVRLTAGGKRFLDGARRTLDEANAAIARARDARQSADGPLVIGVVNPELRPALLQRALRRYRRAMPAVAVHMESMLSIAMPDALRSRAIDVAIGHAITAPTPAVTLTPIADDAMAGIIVAREHPLGRRRRVSILELARYSFLWFDRAMHPALFDRIFAAFHQVGFTPRYVPAIGPAGQNAAPALALVASGYGWALLPTTARAALPPTLRYIPLTDLSIPLSIDFLTRSDDRSARTRAFATIVRDIKRA